MKRRFILLLLPLLLLAGCAKRAPAAEAAAAGLPAWASDSAPLSELLDGTLEDAVRFAVYGSSGYDGESVACGAAVPVWALRGGVWERETALTPFYCAEGQTHCGFLYPLEDGALCARLVTQRVDGLAWWRYRRLAPGSVCFLATSEGVTLLHESGKAIPFWREPIEGLDPAPDWETFSPPAELDYVPLAETARFAYDPEQFARYDPLTGLRAVDESWTVELIARSGSETMTEDGRAALSPDATAELGALLGAMPPEQSPGEEIDGVTEYELRFTAPTGERRTLWFTPAVLSLNACDSWGYRFHVPLPQETADALEVLCKAALG